MSFFFNLGAMESQKCIQKKLYIKNMLCSCSIKLLEIYFKQNNIETISIKLGFAEIKYNTQEIQLKDIEKIIAEAGFELITNREIKIVEQIKIAVQELIHEMNNTDSILRKSEYLVEKTGMNYRYLSNLFSSYEPVTLEKYIILNKIEKIKNLIDSEEYTLSEISYMMDYNSVQYLSNQFKKETGMSVSEYKNSDRSSKKALDRLY